MGIKRLDTALYEKGLTASRTIARQAVEAGLATVNGKIVTKAGHMLKEGDEAALLALPHSYVGRGGVKLKHALERFDIDVNGLVALDVGASTGGFTDCLLQSGAARVYAVDVGTCQLADKLRTDSRVVSCEKTDIRDLQFVETVDLITVDVSFISLEKVFPYLGKHAKNECQLVLLVKPQFETPPSAKNKKGVVKNAGLREAALGRVSAAAQSCGWRVRNSIHSPIAGGSGNLEYLMYLIRSCDSR